MLNKIENAIELDRKDLIKALQQLKNVRPGHTSIPSLKTGQIVVRGGKTFLSAFNSEQYIEWPVSDSPMFDPSNSKYCEIDIDQTLGLMKQLKDDSIEMYLDDKKVEFRGAKATAKREFQFQEAMWSHPVWDDPESGTKEIELDCSVLIPTISQVLTSVSFEDTRYYLCGVFIEFMEAGEIIFTATNGHHLTRRAITSDHGMQGESFILPTASVKTLITMSKTKTGVVKITYVDGAKVVFEFEDGSILWSTTIGGTYPDYRRVIPQDNKMRIQFDKEELLETVNLFVRGSAQRNPGDMVYEKLPTGVKFWNSDKKGSSVESVIPCVFEKGKGDFCGAVNPAYFKILIENCLGDNVLIEFYKPGVNSSPVTIYGSGRHSEMDLEVIMPARATGYFKTD